MSNLFGGPHDLAKPSFQHLDFAELAAVVASQVDSCPMRPGSAESL